MNTTFFALTSCVFNARQYSVVKDLDRFERSAERTQFVPQIAGFMVGLGRVELPTSPLSGVRSSQLSYRPMLKAILWHFPLVELVGIEPAAS